MKPDPFDRLVELESLGLVEADLVGLTDPLANLFDGHEDPAKALFRLMRQPDYFYFTCRHLFGIELVPFQCVILKTLWTHPFPLLCGNRGMGKSFLLGIYSMLKAVLQQGSKVVLTGAGFRQAKQIFQVCEKIWNDSPLLRSIFADDRNNGVSHSADRWMIKVGDSTIVALPLGDGQKIRGERANCVIADEFASVLKEIFETVVAGFGVVNLSPVQQIKDRARIRVLKRLGQWTEELAESHRKFRVVNQLLIAGTAYYQFNHFFEYWKKWKTIVDSQGRERVLREAFDGEFPEDLDWRDYCVMRIPHGLLPEGYLDAKQVARQKVTIHLGNFFNEYEACFATDSNGFFRRLLVETCVTSVPVLPNVPGASPVTFKVLTRGHHDRQYVIGVDPASENDRLSLLILEVHGNHRRIVHCWTTKRQEFKARMAGQQTKEDEYYGFIARRIRDLMESFPTTLIPIDSQGGGIAVIESLGSTKGLKEGELPIYPVKKGHALWDGKERDSDNMRGLHIIVPISFADSAWVSEANHGLRKDFEDRKVLFPAFDPVELAVATAEDNKAGRMFDTLEDCMMEIEELKDELASITHTQTPGTLRDKWDTPEVKLPGMKKGRLRKDRYSSLLMANMAARSMEKVPPPVTLTPWGGFIDHMVVGGQDGDDDGPDEMFAQAPDDWSRGCEDNIDDYGFVAGW